jgi:hypothetical protein
MCRNLSLSTALLFLLATTGPAVLASTAATPPPLQSPGQAATAPQPTAQQQDKAQLKATEHQAKANEKAAKAQAKADKAQAKAAKAQRKSMNAQEKAGQSAADKNAGETPAPPPPTQ